MNQRGIFYLRTFWVLAVQHAPTHVKPPFEMAFLIEQQDRDIFEGEVFNVIQ